MDHRGGQPERAADLFNGGISLEAFQDHFECEVGGILLFLCHLYPYLSLSFHCLVYQVRDIVSSSPILSCVDLAHTTYLKTHVYQGLPLFSLLLSCLCYSVYQKNRSASHYGGPKSQVQQSAFGKIPLSLLK